MRHAEWEFEVTAFYRGRQVFQQTLFCPGGLRLVGTTADNRTLPGQPVTLPDPEGFLTDRPVREYVSQVLKGLGKGLFLWRSGQCLRAQRLGRSHSFWALGDELLPDSGRGPDGEVPKDQDGVVFDLGLFVTGEYPMGIDRPWWWTVFRACSSVLWQRTGPHHRIWGLAAVTVEPV